MGVKERQEREKEAVGRAILDAATALFVAEGYQHVSIRKIAERIEYSPAAIYSYFQSKDDIFYALAEEGFRMLSDALRITPGPDALEDIRRLCWAVFEFSKEHPEHYALMFLDRSVPRISRDWERFRFVHEMKAQAAQFIQRAIDEGYFPAGTDAAAALMVLFAALHGATSMCLCDRMGQGEEPDALARDTLEVAIAGLRAGITYTFHPESVH